MPRVERFMVQSYNRDADGDLIADEPQRYDSPDEAEERLQSISKKCDGAVAYAWSGDMHNSEIGKVSLLSSVGSVPTYAAIALGIEEHAL